MFLADLVTGSINLTNMGEYTLPHFFQWWSYMEDTKNDSSHDFIKFT